MVIVLKRTLGGLLGGKHDCDSDFIFTQQAPVVIEIRIQNWLR